MTTSCQSTNDFDPDNGIKWDVGINNCTADDCGTYCVTVSYWAIPGDVTYAIKAGTELYMDTVNGPTSGSTGGVCEAGECVPGDAQNGDTLCQNVHPEWVTECTTAVCTAELACAQVATNEGGACGDQTDTACDNPNICIGGVCDEQYVPSGTSSGSDCGVGECYREGSCDGMGNDVCEPGAPSPDDNCDGLDDDCDGTPDNDYAPVPTDCGVGACASTGETSCVDGEIVDSCTPGAPAPDDATCDGIDDDCDGVADEDYVPTPTSCGVGECGREGQLICVDGELVDTCAPGEPTPDDQCDGLDNDCDGTPDNDYVPTPTDCGVGECGSTGELVCEDGNLRDTCAPGAPTPDDNCDGLDNDCDGTPDNDYVPTPTSCGVGECGREGLLVCEDGNLRDTCEPGAPTPDDQCDGLDNDCDGTADEEYEPTPTECGVGECRNGGAMVCEDGKLRDTCEPGAPSPDDQCDGLDNDCDGDTDEGYEPTPTTCGVGECGSNGHLVCVGGDLFDTCEPGAPSPDDNCDGLDNDCDGEADEDYVPTSTSCGVGECERDGMLVCAGGGLVNTCAPGEPTPDDNCDGLDNDCDGTPDDDYIPRSTTCGEGDCDSEGQLICDDGNLVDTCNPNAKDGRTCGPLEGECFVPDVCGGGICRDQGPKDSGTPCGDSSSDQCDDADTCDGNGSCQPNHKPSGTSCEDGSYCTSADGRPGSADACDGDGNCRGQDVDCDDGLFCTGTETCNEDTDSCDSSGDPCPNTQCNTCQEDADNCFDPPGTGCGDGDPCTSSTGAAGEGDTCNGSGTCNGTTVTSDIEVLKLTEGVVDPAEAWVFAIFDGPNMGSASDFLNNPLIELNSGGIMDGVIQFNDFAPGVYTLCETDVPAGWSSEWFIDTDGDGTAETAVIPYNPNDTDVPSEDYGNRCFDFDIGAGSDYDLECGATLRFKVDNQFPGGNPRTPGYWKNWSSCTGGGQYAKTTDDVDPDNEFVSLDEVLNDPGVVWDDILVDNFLFAIVSCEDAVRILDQRDLDGGRRGGAKHASDAAYTLAMHLLAAQLNFGAGACLPVGGVEDIDGDNDLETVPEIAAAAEALLDSLDFNASGSFLEGKGKKDDLYPRALYLADLLDRYNNGEFCGDFAD